jgi:hypothetical protein
MAIPRVNQHAIVRTPRLARHFSAEIRPNV